MDLIDRYLAAIARRLPAAQGRRHRRRDSRRICNRDRGAGGGARPPARREGVGALIKEFGHPLVVAARYRPQQYLIGPDLSLLLVRADVVVAMFLRVAGVAASANVFGHAAESPARVSGGAGGRCSAMPPFGTVGIFAALERTGFPADHLRNGRPRNCPTRRLKARQAQASGASAFEVAVGVYFILWWCGLVPLPPIRNVKGLTLAPDPIWAAIWWPVLVLMVARLVYNLVQWLRPRWKAVRGVLRSAPRRRARACWR